MITATRPSMWRNRWDVARDGTTLVRFEQSSWRSRGRFTLDGRGYLLTARGLGSRYELHAHRVTAPRRPTTARR